MRIAWRRLIAVKVDRYCEDLAGTQTWAETSTSALQWRFGDHRALPEAIAEHRADGNGVVGQPFVGRHQQRDQVGPCSRVKTLLTELLETET